MSDKLQAVFLELVDKAIGFLPALLAGIFLLLIGWLIAWFIKRLVVQICIILKMERYLTRFSRGTAFSKADVRYGLYNILGNIAFLVIFLIFFDFALITWNLEFLSTLLGKGILYFPNVIVAFAIFSVGWLISLWATHALQKLLIKEAIERATFIALYAKTLIIILFAAMALTELNIAREIVIIGFASIFVTLGAIAVVLTAVGGKSFIKPIIEPSERKEEDNNDRGSSL
jgi:hypothetical protein